MVLRILQALKTMHILLQFFETDGAIKTKIELINIIMISLFLQQHVRQSLHEVSRQFNLVLAIFLNKEDIEESSLSQGLMMRGCHTSCRVVPYR